MASNPNEPVPPSAPSGDTLFAAQPRTRKSRPGLDVLLTKAAIDFQNIVNEDGQGAIRENLEALREAASLDAIFFATFDADNTIIANVVAAAGLFAGFN